VCDLETSRMGAPYIYIYIYIYDISSLRVKRLLIPFDAKDVESLGVHKGGKVHPCTGIEALYRPYGP